MHCSTLSAQICEMIDTAPSGYTTVQSTVVIILIYWVETEDIQHSIQHRVYTTTQSLYNIAYNTEDTQHIIEQIVYTTYYTTQSLQSILHSRENTRSHKKQRLVNNILYNTQYISHVTQLYYTTQSIHNISYNIEYTQHITQH